MPAAAAGRGYWNGNTVRVIIRHMRQLFNTKKHENTQERGSPEHRNGNKKEKRNRPLISMKLRPNLTRRPRCNGRRRSLGGERKQRKTKLLFDPPININRRRTVAETRRVRHLPQRRPSNRRRLHVGVLRLDHSLSRTNHRCSRVCLA